MAFSSTVSGASYIGPFRCLWGTYTNTAESYGGAITTNINYVVFAGYNSTTYPVATLEGSIALTSTSAGTVTLYTQRNDSGTWFVMGN